MKPQAPRREVAGLFDHVTDLMNSENPDLDPEPGLNPRSRSQLIAGGREPELVALLAVHSIGLDGQPCWEENEADERINMLLIKRKRRSA